MSSPPHTTTLTLTGVLSETKRIINSHSRHFLALSVLFLLPLSFSLIIINPFLSLPNSPIHSHYNTQQSFQFSFLFSSSPLPQFEKSDLILPTLYTLFVILFSLFATASITHSTYHGFYGRPVKLVSSIKNVIFTFLPLVSTLIVMQLCLGLVLLAFGGFGVFLGNGLVLVGVDVGYGSWVFVGLVILVAVSVLWVLVYLQVEWYLVNVVVVVESRWGFDALRRSSYLVRGMRRVVLLMFLLFDVLIGVLSMMCTSLVPDGGQVSVGWVSWAYVFQTIVCAGFMTILMLYSVAANAVLFMYCKAMRGELAFEIAEEFSREYVSLPFDDGKVPHIVYVV